MEGTNVFSSACYAIDTMLYTGVIIVNNNATFLAFTELKIWDREDRELARQLQFK